MPIKGFEAEPEVCMSVGFISIVNLKIKNLASYPGSSILFPQGRSLGTRLQESQWPQFGGS